MKKFLFLLIVGLTVFSVNHVSAQVNTSAFLPVYFQNNSGYGSCIYFKIKDMNGETVKAWHANVNGEWGICFDNTVLTRYLATYQLNVGDFYIISFNYSLENPNLRNVERAFIHKQNQRVDFVANSSTNASIVFTTEEFR